MSPRISRSVSTILVTAAAVLPLVHALDPLAINYPSTPGPDALQNVVQDNFFGISWELAAMNVLWGKTTSTMPVPMQNYLSNLASRSSQPLRMRIGGNGMDGSTYDPNLPVFSQVDHPELISGQEIPVTFGPIFFDVLNAMSDKVGPMQFIVGVSLRNVSDPNGVVFAKASKDKLGNRLDSLLLGNEPDLYAGHEKKEVYEIVGNYIPDLQTITKNLEAADAIEPGHNIIAGPATCCNDWTLDKLFDANFQQFPWKYYAVQHYPNNVCFGINAGNTDVTPFLTHSRTESYLSWEDTGVMEAKASGVPVVISEFNSLSCGGSNISSTFTMSLWSIDVGLKAASMNFTATYIHTRELGIQYNLFDPPTEDTATQSGWSTGSPYYGALFMSEAFDSTGSVSVDLNLANGDTTDSATSAAYAIYSDAGKTRSKLALINFHRTDVQAYTIPSGLGDTLEYKILTAPSVFEKKNISWAGQTVDGNGKLAGNLQTLTKECKTGCTIEVPGPGAALVSLKTGVLFSGTPSSGLSSSGSAKPTGTGTSVADSKNKSGSGGLVGVALPGLVSATVAVACVASWMLVM